MLNHIAKIAFLLIAAAGMTCAQESRGSISGKVTDAQGGLIAGANVVVTNTDTNVANRLTTNQTGYFEVNLLNPGRYSIAVEATGFKREVRSGLDLNVGGRLDLDFQMQIGQVAETIEVTGAAPLLETSTASAGRVIDQKQVTELPFSDMNPFALSALSAGMQWTGQPEYRRPFDNGGTSSFNTAGNAGSNEYSIDGAPATGTGRRVGFVPSSDAVQEFKLETANFDPASGHTAGATINVSTKSGTNTYHGSLFDQHWQQRWNATQHFTRLLYDAGLAKGTIKPGDQKQAPGRSNQFGASFGGPVRIPKIYNGRDKLFFFFQYDGIYQAKAETTDSINRTVPKMAWRQGDFSDLLAIDATKYQIYDPRSASLQNGHTVRLPFPGNKGVPILNPMYKSYEPLYPKPNDVPGLVSPEGANNYLAFAMPKNEKFNSIVNRVDYNINDRHRVFGRWYWNHRLANEYDWTYETKLGLHANGLTRINKGVGGNWIWTLSGNTVLDVGVNGTRFNEGSDNSVRTAYKPSSVGLPAYIDARAGAYAELPRINFSNIEDVSDSYPAITIRGTIGEAKVNLNTIRGSHSFAYGYSERRYWTTTAGPGNSAGSFSFDNSYTRRSDDTTTASNTGLEWAAFMMGVPSGISIDTNDTALWSSRFRALYFKDDWRLSSKFRLTYGLRYEREAGITERFNRGMSGEFDPNYVPPFAAAVEKAYAANPIAGVPSIKVIGGTNYLGAKTNTFTDGTHHFMPRVGGVYQINNKTVLRAGYGWYWDTFNPSNDRPDQYGFNQSTGTTITTDRGLTFCCGVGAAANIGTQQILADPFPVRADGTRFDSPLGNKLGQNAKEGQGWTYRPRGFEPAKQQRWRVGVQRQFSNNAVLEVSYNGAWSEIPLSQKQDYLPAQNWATGNVRVQSVDDRLNTNVPNPFNVKNYPDLASTNAVLYNWMTQRGFFNGTTIRTQQLLRQNPNMNGLNGYVYRGRNKYHDLQVQFDKRFARGFSTSVGYTRAYGWKSDFFANEFDRESTWRQNNDVRPHRLVWYSIYELPFGKGRKWMNRNPLQHIVGGWLVSWIYQYQSGPATSWGNRFFYGDINNIAALLKHDQVHSNDIHAWFDKSIAYTSGSGAIPSSFQGFEGRSAYQPGSYHVRVFPTLLDSLREDGIRNWDAKIKREFKIHERLRTTFAVDLLNATNHTNFSGPNTDPTNKNFGQLTSQRGLSRVIQFNLRIDF